MCRLSNSSNQFGRFFPDLLSLQGAENIHAMVTNV